MSPNVQFGFTADQMIRDGFLAAVDIKKIRSWIEGQNLPPIRDEQIVFFVMSCCGDLRATQKTIRAYYEIRIQNCDVFGDWRLERDDVRKISEILYSCVPSIRTPDNYAFYFSRYHALTYANFDLLALATYGLMTLDAAVYQKPANGLVAVLDMHGMTFWHLTKLSIRLLKPLFRYVQEALPIRLEIVHVLNTPSFIGKLMLILKPFMNAELLQKMHFHPTNLNWEQFFDKHIPSKYVPADFCGLLPPMSVLHEENKRLLAKNEGNFKWEEELRRNF